MNLQKLLLRLFVLTLGIWLLVACGAAKPEPGQIRGTIVDRVTEQPIEGARLQITVGGKPDEGFQLVIGEDPLETTTAESGTFVFEDLVPESYFIICFFGSDTCDWEQPDFIQVSEGEIVDLGVIPMRKP
jgi:hypothetical protein